MSACCEDEARELERLRERQVSVLWAVLAISALAFGVEFGAGVWARSTSLLGDSLDMLSDAFVYAFSLSVLHRSARSQAGAALAKGGLMAVLGIGVLFEAFRRLAAGQLPDASAMALVALLALVANGACFALLFRHRSDDLNLRSTWLCTRNDLVANVAVVAAAALVSWTGSLWPDLVVGVAVAALFLRTAFTVLCEAAGQWGAAEAASSGSVRVGSRPHHEH